MYDVIIIGAGVSGCATARELSKYKINACVLERCSDVNCGTSKANSGIVHAGFDAAEGSLMARLNVRGNEMLWELSRTLDIPAYKCGSLVVAIDKDDIPKLQVLYERGIKNGVKGLKIIDRNELRTLEPNISDNACAALYAPSAGIIDPFMLNIALAENAYCNGVDFRFDTAVTAIDKRDGFFTVHTTDGDFEAKHVINAAGVYSDEIHNMVSERKIKIIPRRGDYCLLDNEAGNHVSHTIFPLPGKFGKGILVSPTVHGNLIVGPTAIDIEDKEGINTTRDGLDAVISKSGMYVKNLPMRKVITSFAGLRAHHEDHEFIIREVEDAKGFIDCAAIESPGLTSCAAIGEMVVEILKTMLPLEENPNFCGTRKGTPYFKGMTNEERSALIKKDPAYGRVVCRCETVTEGEILDAIHRPLGATTLDGIKKRTRAGMGRCQAGFCTQRAMELLARELGVNIAEITKNGGKSKLISGTVKDTL